MSVYSSFEAGTPGHHGQTFRKLTKQSNIQKAGKHLLCGVHSWSTGLLATSDALAERGMAAQRHSNRPMPHLGRTQ